MIQSTMKAIALDRFGGLETMKLQMLPVPEVGPGEVLIHVEWAGVGKWDPFEREGGFAKAFGIEPKSLCTWLQWRRHRCGCGQWCREDQPRRARLRFRPRESQGRFLRRVRRDQGRRRLAHPRQADDPAGRRYARGRYDRAARVG